MTGINDCFGENTPKKENYTKATSISLTKSVLMNKELGVCQKKVNNFLENKQEIPSFRDNSTMKIQEKDGNYCR